MITPAIKYGPWMEHLKGGILFAVSLALVTVLDINAADTLAPKTWWMASGAAAVAALFVLRLWWGGKIFLPPKTIILSLGLMLAAVAISAFFSDLEKTTEPAVNAWLLLGALFVAAVDSFAREPKGLNRFFEVGIAALLLCLVWQGLQLAGLDPSAWGSRYASQFSGRAAAGLGNPNFLAGVLVLLAPMGLARLWNTPWRWSGGLSLMALAWLGALATASKAALLGVGFEFFCLGHLLWHSTLNKEVRLKAIKIWLSALVLGLVSILAMPQTRARLWEGVSLQSDSFQFRANTLQGGMKIWSQAPLFGGGPGSFFALYPAAKPKEAMQTAAQHSYEVTHPENWVVQILSEMGLFGLAALLWLFWLIGRPLWKQALRLEEEKGGIAVALTMALGGSLMMNFAALDLFLPQSFWFFVWILAAGAALNEKSCSAIRIEPESYASLLVSAVLVLGVLFISAQAWGRWAASKELEAGKRLARQESFQLAQAALRNAAALDPANPEALYFYGIVTMQTSANSAAQEGLELLNRLQRLAPDYVLIHENRAMALEKLGKISEAILSWKRQIELDPYYKAAWIGLANLYAQNKQWELLIAHLEMAGNMFPQDQDFKRNLQSVKAAAQEKS